MDQQNLLAEAILMYKKNDMTEFKVNIENIEKCNRPMNLSKLKYTFKIINQVYFEFTWKFTFCIFIISDLPLFLTVLSCSVCSSLFLSHFYNTPYYVNVIGARIYMYVCAYRCTKYINSIHLNKLWREPITLFQGLRLN